jgi:hypothetical protein
MTARTMKITNAIGLDTNQCRREEHVFWWMATNSDLACEGDASGRSNL